MEWFDRGKMVILRLTDLGIALLALGIILQLLFGNAMPFLGNDIAANIMTFIKGLGGQGLVGLVAIAVVFYILNRKICHLPAGDTGRHLDEPSLAVRGEAFFLELDRNERRRHTSAFGQQHVVGATSRSRVDHLERQAG